MAPSHFGPPPTRYGRLPGTGQGAAAPCGTAPLPGRPAGGAAGAIQQKAQPAVRGAGLPPPPTRYGNPPVQAKLAPASPVQAGPAQAAPRGMNAAMGVPRAGIVQAAPSPSAPVRCVPHGSPVRPPTPPSPGRIIQAMMRQDALPLNYIEYGDFVASPFNAILEKGEDSFEFVLIIEVMEKTAASAIKKIQKAAANGLREYFAVAFIIGLNMHVASDGAGLAQAPAEKISVHTSTRRSADKGWGQRLDLVEKDAETIAKVLGDCGFLGGCIPFLWSKTSGGGYFFPFFEGRALLTRHPQVTALHSRLRQRCGSTPVVRSMDGDVVFDHLLTLKPKSRKEAWSGEMQAQEAERRKKANHQKAFAGYLKKELGELAYRQIDLVSGAYMWDQKRIDENELVRACTKEGGSAMNGRLMHVQAHGANVVAKCKEVIRAINAFELNVRKKISQQSSPAYMYWPEPNTYMTLDAREKGADEMLKLAAASQVGTAQQGESTKYVRSLKRPKGVFSGALSTKKPLKTWLDNVLVFVVDECMNQQDTAAQAVVGILDNLHQSHMRSDILEDVVKWQGEVSTEVLRLIEATANETKRECAAAIAGILNA